MRPKEPKTPPFTEATWERLRTDPAFAQAFFEGYRKESIPIQITLLRSLAGISQVELAKKLDIKQTHLSRLEKDGSDHLVSAYVEVAQRLNARLVLVPNEAQIEFNR